MSCSKCGSACQGGLCKFCAREKSREGDWQDQLGGYDTSPEDNEVDELELRGQLLETAAEYERQRFEAEKAGNDVEADYCRRQKEQARIGFNSLRGGDA